MESAPEDEESAVLTRFAMEPAPFSAAAGQADEVLSSGCTPSLLSLVVPVAIISRCFPRAVRLPRVADLRNGMGDITR